MEHRPWGWFKVLANGNGFVVKELFVKNGERTSLQYHRYRKEIWIIIEGKGKATIDNSIVYLEPGNVVVVDKGVKHRLEGGSEGLRLVEVWIGDVLDENDIIRLEDDYGRK